MSESPRAGLVYFIGAGPGDAGLLTLRGTALLARSDVVLHDARVHPSVLDHGPADRIAVGEGGEKGLEAPERIAAKAVALAGQGRVVARLAAGDPYLFASGDEEVAFVSRRGVAFEVVPGIVGSIAAGAYAGIPLSRRADASPSVALVDARGGLSVHEWGKLADATDVLAVLVARDDVEELARTLVFHGRSPDEPAAVLVDVGLPTQHVVTGPLEDIHRLASGRKESPVRLYVGEVVARREPLCWFDRRPLFGKRVLVTRAREQASAAAELLRERGAEPVVVPTIELHPPRDPEAVLRAIARTCDGHYAWVVFTSANGVHRSWDALGASGKDARAFGACRLAAIGPATAQALQEHGLRADVVARELHGEGLAEEMLRALGASAAATAVNVLVLRAEEAREVLPEALRAAGCTVDVVGVYETRPVPDAAERLRDAVLHGRLDAVTFSSSSTVDNLCDALGEGAASMLEPLRVVSIGPITTATAVKRGLRVDATAAQSTLPGLVDALAASFTEAAVVGRGRAEQ